MAKKKPVEFVPRTAFVMPSLPKTLKVDPLLAAVLHLMTFLEFSEDKTVDPDDAVEAMESVAFYFRQMTPAQIEKVASQLAKISDHAKKSKMSEEFVEYVDTFLENLGVGETDDD